MSHAILRHFHAAERSEFSYEKLDQPIAFSTILPSQPSLVGSAKIYMKFDWHPGGNVARKKTPETRVNIKAEISGRLREVRQGLYGDHGGPDLARRLSLPARTWYNYETGVTVPAEVLLNFIDQTGANPKWLLSGESPKFRHESDNIPIEELSPSDLIRRSLDRLAKEVANTSSEDSLNDFVRIGVLPLSDLTRPAADCDASLGHVLVDRSWIANPEMTVVTPIEDDAMTPILPQGSLVAVDLSVRDPGTLCGRIVVAQAGGRILVRWFEQIAPHMILRPNRPAEYPLIKLETDRSSQDAILGQVVWSWSLFSKGSMT